MSIEIVVTYPDPKMPAGLEMEECKEQVRERREDILRDVFRTFSHRWFGSRFGSPSVSFEHDSRVTERTITVGVSGTDATKEAFEQSGVQEEVRDGVIDLLDYYAEQIETEYLVRWLFPCFADNFEVQEVIDLLEDEDDPNSVVGTCEKLHARFRYGGEGPVYVAYYPKYGRGGVALNRIPDGTDPEETWGYAKSLDETWELWERNLLGE